MWWGLGAVVIAVALRSLSLPVIAPALMSLACHLEFRPDKPVLALFP